MSVCCIRGAITIEENTREQVLDNTKILINKIMEENNVSIDDIISITFTATKDIDAAYPAVGARQLGINDAALVCFQEMNVVGSLKMCIRAMVMINSNKSQKDLNHIYLKGAVVLRPDIVQKKNPVKLIDAIAIDGPAGSGKSTAAKAVAKRIGYVYVDTGAMYRTVGLYCLENNIDINDESSVALALDSIDISIKYTDGIQKIYLNGNDVTEKIRTQQAAAMASAVAVIGVVREKLVDMQRKIAAEKPVVMDGRDIGSNVLKNARTKIYMDASVEERTRRRCKELSEKGIDFDQSVVRQEIIDRDNNDKNRKLNPLTIAPDATVIDTSGMNIEQTVEKIIDIMGK